MTPAEILQALTALRTAMAAGQEALELFERTKASMSSEDREAIEREVKALQGENDEGFARLDAKLAAAARR